MTGTEQPQEPTNRLFLQWGLKKFASISPIDEIDRSLGARLRTLRVQVESWSRHRHLQAAARSLADGTATMPVRLADAVLAAGGTAASCNPAYPSQCRDQQTN